MKSFQKWGRFIAIYEMFGGIIGLLITIFISLGLLPQELLKIAPISHKLFLVIIIIFAISAYSISFIAGYFLWKKNFKGVPLSILIQILQIPQFTIAHLTYSFISGGELAIIMSNSGLKFNIYLGSHWSIWLSSSNKPFLLGFNILAIVILVLLIKEYTKRNSRLSSK